MSASQWLRGHASLLFLILVLAIPLVNPIGYVGGAADDVHYLAAARCWVSFGHPCLPDTHWASRWPAIAPIAALTSLLGESRLTVSVGPFIAWVACVLLVFELGHGWFDRSTAIVASLLFAAVPVVSQSAFQPNVDTTELALQLGALCLAREAYRRQSATHSFLAGMAAALSVQARDTSLLFCATAALAWFGLERDRRSVLLWALAGFAAASAGELATYAAATGDPLFRYHLALHHVAVPSEEMAAVVDTTKSPLFNRDYIAGWRHDWGIALWWPVDPWLNLIASPRTGYLFAGALVALPLGFGNLSVPQRQIAIRLLGCGLLIATGLIYVLAIDPKPRMFFALIAAVALALAATTVSSWRAGRGAVPAVVVALIVVSSVRLFSSMTDTHQMEDRARRWIAANPGGIEIDPVAHTTLTLVPESRALPAAGAGRPMRIAGSDEGCNTFGLEVVDRAGSRGSGELCLLKVGASPVAAAPSNQD